MTEREERETSGTDLHLDAVVAPAASQPVRLRIRRLVRWLNGKGPDTRLLEQFYDGLACDLTSNLRPDAPRATTYEISRILSTSERRWSRAYTVERMMGPLLRDEVLAVKLQRRLAEARRIFSGNVADRYRADAVPDTAAEQLALYDQLLDDLQWHYTKRETRRASIRTIKFLRLITFLVAAAIAGWMWPGVNEDRLLACSIAGLLGAGFSMLTGLKGLETLSHEELRVGETLMDPVARAFSGLIAGAFMFFFLGSTLAPQEFVTSIGEDAAPTSAGIATLLVLAFAAGFSERLVGSLVRKGEESLQPKTDPGGPPVPPRT